MRVAIYTAIFGGYDRLKTQPQQTIDCDYFCFTDVKQLSVEGWRQVHVASEPNLHPRMQAKYYKILAHKIFPAGRLDWRYLTWKERLRRVQYDAIIWLDGSIQINSRAFVEEFVHSIDQSGWAMFVHPERDCIYDEAEVSSSMPKYRDQQLRQQADAYRAEGYPANNGLFACGIIGRDPHSSVVKLVGEDWWRENTRWTYQDQISLPVVLWRRGLCCATVKLNLWDNPWLSYIPHVSSL